MIPNGTTMIVDYAFDGCTDLTSITIPDSVTRIGNSAFNGCTGLTSITIPDSVTKIGHGRLLFRDVTCPCLTGASTKSEKKYFSYSV